MKEEREEEEEEKVKRGEQCRLKNTPTLNPAPMKGRAPVTRGRDAIPGGKRVRRNTNQMTYKEARVMTDVVTMVPVPIKVAKKGSENMK